MGKSGLSLCRYLLKEGALLTCFDRKTPDELGAVYDELKTEKIIWNLGPKYLDSLPNHKYIFLTPGMKKHLPEIVQARRKGAVISTEIDLFLKRCKAVVGGITGSAGKTTTSMLTKLMVEQSMPDGQILVGGNIGSVLIEKVDELPESAIVILELSSFQLQLCQRSPKFSLLLNVRPNHLDIHKDFQEYINAKKNIFRFQSKRDWSFFNYDDCVTGDAALECPGNFGLFSLNRPPDHMIKAGYRLAWLEHDNLMYTPGNGELPCALAQTKDLLIPGRHNISNALGAILLSLQLGACPSIMKKALGLFRGIEHRIEFVREFCGVKFYNDSIATTPDRVIALIDSLSDPLVLILGGYDKGLDFTELATKFVKRRCKGVVLGECSDKIKAAISYAWSKSNFPGQPDIIGVSSLQQAVLTAREMAVSGASVALSPGCASYDMFSSFEQRGKIFKQIVKSL